MRYLFFTFEEFSSADEFILGFWAISTALGFFTMSIIEKRLDRPRLGQAFQCGALILILAGFGAVVTAVPGLQAAPLSAWSWLASVVGAAQIVGLAWYLRTHRR